MIFLFSIKLYFRTLEPLIGGKLILVVSSGKIFLSEILLV